jgi:hypothetical protein
MAKKVNESKIANEEIESAIVIEETKSEVSENMSKWLEFFDEDGLKVAIDITTIRAIEDVSEEEYDDFEFLQENKELRKGVILSFNFESDEDKYLFGHSFMELISILREYERSQR